MASSSKGEVVLITGGNGCLGQFIVKLLQERDQDTTEIRIYDLTGYTKRLDFEDRIPMQTIVGDIRHVEPLTKACQGVNCVIHTAALIDISTEPDVKAMKNINVEGTRNVIKACVNAGVGRLIFTSTVDVVVGRLSLPHVREDNAPIPKRFLMGDYAATKYEAESLVLQADRTPLANGSGVFRTLALRPVVTFGEGDKYFVTGCLKNALTRGGTLLRVDNGIALHQPAYVGNIAWAHVVAKQSMAHVPDKVAGLPYFISDDTMPINFFDFVEPFLEARGLHVSKQKTSFWLVYVLYMLAQFILNLMSVVHKPPVKLPSMAQIKYTIKTFIVSRLRATYRLRYSPIYLPVDAMKNSINYYKNVPL